jgi:hypothetical protein
MLDIEQFSDDSGGVCNLDVQSSPFQAQIKFFFDNPSLLKFIDQLKNLENSLSGKARLGNMYEDPYIQFEGNGRGHVTVSGKLQVSGDHSQQLEFEFRTDQTALGPFIHELETARLAAPR